MLILGKPESAEIKTTLILTIFSCEVGSSLFMSMADFKEEYFQYRKANGLMKRTRATAAGGSR